MSNEHFAPASTREVLHVELLRRQARNPKYSLRAFAHRLGIHPSMICRILSGKHHLTPKACRRILPTLGLPESEESRFIQLLKDEQLRAAAMRSKALVCREPRLHETRT